MTGGWIKFEKDVRTDPRFLRMLKAHVTQVRITPALAATQLVGALVTLWCYADTHIRDDDTLDLGSDEIDELVGIQGFVALMPVDWLEVLDTHRVKLPGFQEHNGTEAKKRALTQKRVARHRVRNVTQVRSDGEVDSNAGALPDQTRLDQDHRRESAVAPLPKIDPRGTRIPDDFELTIERMAVALNESIDPDRTFKNFCDYWRSAPAAKARKVDWDATWRVWCRKDADSKKTPTSVADKAKRTADEQRALADLRTRAGRIQFRDFDPDKDDVIGYRTLVERAESNIPRRASQ